MTEKKCLAARALCAWTLLASAAACGATADEDTLWLYGDVPLSGTPAYEYRILDHWDNLDDSVERGYAGPSIWGWTSEELPAERIETYARLNEKLGINGAVLNNVNTAPQILRGDCLARVAQIARILRAHGMRTFLSVNFASPSALGELPTSDPLAPEVQAWWRDKVEEIYSLIPDFGGFLVKASSEGQPGPGDYGRTHADGANMLADALAPHGGIVMWRAFVYSASSPDRAMQAYEEFMPLDGQFRDNVTVQIKNGPIDFQPREPFSPLFGGLRHTSMTPELQITQEYLGQSRNLVFTAPMWEECLKSDTYRDGEGSSVAAVTSKSPVSAIAGVANTGQSPDWCGSVFAQANWYAFGRLAWDPTLTSEQIAEEWLRLTFPKPRFVSARRFTRAFIEPVKAMMLSSREACVDYMMPLGLHHLFAADHHYGPEPWCDVEGFRPDWLPSYYHRADSAGIGFDRTLSGSGAVEQYNEPLASLYGGPDCPDEYLLWFHHLGWDYRMRSGDTLWNELCRHYDRGVKTVRSYRDLWAGMKPFVDRKRYESVAETLRIQERDAVWWRDACVGYFGSFSRRPLPPDVEPLSPQDGAIEKDDV